MSPALPSRRARAVALVFVLLAPAALGVAAASPAPVPVCGPCGTPFEYAAEGHDVELTVERSVATVRVHENGSATWTVRNRIGDERAVERLRENPSLVDRIAADTLEMRGVSAHEHVLLDASISADGVVTMRYRTPDFATRTNGVLRVEYFRDDPGVYVYTGLGADRLTVVGPEGTVVTSGLPGATVDGRRLTVTSLASRGDGPFVVFAPADDPLRDVDTALAIAGVVVPFVVRNVVLFVAVPAGVLAGLLAGVAAVVGRVDAPATVDRARRAGVAVAGLGVVLAAHPWYADAAPLIGGYEPPLLAGSVAAAVVGAAAAVRPDRFGLPAQVGAIAGGLAVGAVAVLAAPAVVPGYVPNASAMTVLTPVPALLALPVGYAAKHGTPRARRAALAVPAVALAVGAIVRFPLTAAGSGFFLLGALLLVGYAVVVVLFGLPLAALGAVLPRSPAVGWWDRTGS